MRVFPLLVSFACILLSGTCVADQQRRLALIIAQQNYTKPLSILNNPISDAKEITNSLRHLGFEIHSVGPDADRKTFNKQVRQFVNILDPKSDDIVFVYYSGHGMAYKEIDYILPVDFPMPDLEPDDDTFVTEAISLNDLASAIAHANKGGRTIFVADACRNDVFNGAPEYSKGFHPSREKAFVAPRVQVEGNVMFFLSTSPGFTASDKFDLPDGSGSGKHSIFATYLLEDIETPGVSINDIAYSVQRKVVTASNGSQRPWSMGADTDSPILKQLASREDAEKSVWFEINLATAAQLSLIELYRQSFPNGPHYAEVQKLYNEHASQLNFFKLPSSSGGTDITQKEGSLTLPSGKVKGILGQLGPIGSPALSPTWPSQSGTNLAGSKVAHIGTVKKGGLLAAEIKRLPPSVVVPETKLPQTIWSEASDAIVIAEPPGVIRPTPRPNAELKDIPALSNEIQRLMKFGADAKLEELQTPGGKDEQ